jgi:hypothetical protein
VGRGKRVRVTNPADHVRHPYFTRQILHLLEAPIEPSPFLLLLSEGIIHIV